MISRNKLICSMQVETGALIFAVFNIIITIVAVLTSLGVFCFTLEQLYVARQYDVHTFLVINSAMVMIVTLSIIAFVFSIILAKGVVQRKPGYLKVYLVYGVLVVVLSLATALSLTFVFRNGYEDYVIFMSTIAAIVIVIFFYTLALITIRFTYKKFEREPKLRHSFIYNVLVEKY